MQVVSSSVFFIFMERPLFSSIIIVLGLFGCISSTLLVVESTELNLMSPSQPPPPPPPSSPRPKSPPPPPSPLALPPSPPKMPKKKKNTTKALHSSHGNHQHSPPYNGNHQAKKKKPNQKKMNLGKKIGLLFAGIVGILQVAVFGFLAFRRFEISKINKTRDNCS